MKKAIALALTILLVAAALPLGAGAVTRTVDINSQSEWDDLVAWTTLANLPAGQTHSLTVRLYCDVMVTALLWTPEDVTVNVTITGEGGNRTIEGPGNKDGLILVRAGRVTLRNLTFKNGNRAAGTGGAVYAGSGADITDCVFEGNVANTGGAVLATGDTTLTRCVFRGNGSQAGGAVFIEDGALTLDSCVFENNTSSTVGDKAGAIIMRGAKEVATLTFITDGGIDTNTFTNNEGNDSFPPESQWGIGFTNNDSQDYRGTILYKERSVPAPDSGEWVTILGGAADETGSKANPHTGS